MCISGKMYDDPSLQLVGSPPPTADSRPGSSASNMFVFSDRSVQHGRDRSSRYEDELFGPISGRSDTYHANNRPPSGRPTNGYHSKPPLTPTTPVNNKTKILNKKNKSYGKTKKAANHKPSEVDELLFGHAKPTAEDRLWESSNGVKKVVQTPTSSERSIYNSNYYTKNMRKKETEQPVSRASSRQDFTTRSPSPTSYRPMSATPTRPGSASSPKKQTRNRHNPSYVDEMLFGPKLEEANFPPPWAMEKEPKPHSFDMTDYKTRASSGSDKGRPSHIANGSTMSHSACTPSRQNMSARSARSAKSARPNSQCAIVVTGRPPTPKKELFKKSYVDESLFGPKLEDCDWDAPWENPRDKYKKPLIYDSSDYKMKVEHCDILKPKPRVMSSLHKSISRSTSSLDKKPVWR